MASDKPYGCKMERSVPHLQAHQWRGAACISSFGFGLETFPGKGKWEVRREFNDRRKFQLELTDLRAHIRRNILFDLESFRESFFEDFEIKGGGCNIGRIPAFKEAKMSALNSGAGEGTGSNLLGKRSAALSQVRFIHSRALHCLVWEISRFVGSKSRLFKEEMVKK